MIYDVFTADTAAELAKLVSAKLAQGWQLAGGVSVAVLHCSWENERKGYSESSTDWEYAQAMTNSSMQLLDPSAES